MVSHKLQRRMCLDLKDRKLLECLIHNCPGTILSDRSDPLGTMASGQRVALIFDRKRVGSQPPKVA